MIQNTDYKENKGEFDVCLFDPPFKQWKNVEYIPKAKTYVCFTNFQNRHHVYNLFGVPKFEIIWYFRDGRWVNHKMPRLNHESILIYGDLNNEAYTGDYHTCRKPKKRGYGSVGKDILKPSIYQPRERRILDSVMPISRRGGKKLELGLWGKPEKLIMPILEWIVSPGDNVWDGFAGSGTFGICTERLGGNYFGSEKDKVIFEKAQRRINNARTI
jgi:hypothetical protein